MITEQQPINCFLSFADSRMSAALIRIRKQAQDMHFFDKICVYDESALDTEFKKKWEKALRFGSRGFGYWCWKPYIILKTLESLPDGSILLYCDVGCHLNPKGIEKLRCYFEETRNDSIGIKAFPTFYSRTDILEKRWTKGDLFDYFNCRDRIDITNSDQIATTQILIKKCPSSIEFIKKWTSVWDEDFALIDDSPSKSANFPEFIENRHDQSVFSLLFKLNNCIAFPAGETDVADYSNMDDYPIWDLRDKGFKDKRFFPRIIRYLKSRIFLLKVSIKAKI